MKTFEEELTELLAKHNAYFESTVDETEESVFYFYNKTTFAVLSIKKDGSLSI